MLSDKYVNSLNDTELIDLLGLSNAKYNFSELSTDEQISFLLKAMAISKIGVCQCCGKIRHLINHHWYEAYSFPLKEHGKMICESCNGILTRNNMKFFKFKVPYISRNDEKNNPYVASHILPDWDKQLEFYKIPKYITIA